MSVPAARREGTFQHFDGTLPSCPHSVLALGYRMTDNPADPWTRKFNDFKFGKPVERQLAIERAIDALTQGLRALTPGGAHIGVVCAHGAASTGLVPTASVPMLAYNVSNRLRLTWCGDRITKRPHRSLKTMQGGGAERDREVADMYSAAVLPQQVQVVMILDDFTTRGATIAEVARAVLASNPAAAVLGLVLAKNERAGYYQSVKQEPLTNDHILPEIAKIWP